MHHFQKQRVESLPQVETIRNVTIASVGVMRASNHRFLRRNLVQLLELLFKLEGELSRVFSFESNQVRVEHEPTHVRQVDHSQSRSD